MLSIILEAADVLCPVKRIKIQNNVPGWINNEVIAAINTKRELLRQSIQTGLDNDWNKFRESRNHVRKMLIRARQHVRMTLLEENRKDPNRFWKVLNIMDLSLNERKASNNQCFSRVRGKAGVILEGLHACTFMSDYYALNGVKLAANFKY